MAHLGNTVILVTGGKTCHAILFCIHTHRAELQNLKLLAVLGQAHLLIEGRSAIGLDRNSRNQEQRTQDNQCCQRNYNVHCALNKQELRACHVTADAQHGQVEHMHRPCAAHDNIANAGDDEHIDALPYAVLQDNVSLMAVNTTDKNRFHTVQNGQICQALRHAQGDLHIVFLTQAVLVDELFHTVPHIVDNCGLLRRKGRIVPFMCAGCPDRSHHQLPHNCRNARQ